jgi:tRNA(His) 5'-end guanylyltransferase
MYLINGKMKVFTKIKLNFGYIESEEYNSILSCNEGPYSQRKNAVETKTPQWFCKCITQIDDTWEGK